MYPRPAEHPENSRMNRITVNSAINPEMRGTRRGAFPAVRSSFLSEVWDMHSPADFAQGHGGGFSYVRVFMPREQYDLLLCLNGLKYA